MKFHLGPPIIVPGFPPDDSWQPMKGPGIVGLQIQAVPVAVLVMCFMGLVWRDATTAWDSGEMFWHFPLWWLALFVVVGGPLHELLHALAFPGFGFGPQTYLGIWASKLVPYVVHQGPVSRRRRLVVLLTPFVVMTLLPALLAIILCHNTGDFAFWFDRYTPLLAVFSILNAGSSGADLVMAWRTWRNVPARAQMQGGGKGLYYKLPEVTSLP